MHFFKTFILPHFDYCASLFIFFSKTLLEKIRKVFDSCLFNLLKIDLHGLTNEDQINLLAPYNLMPFYCRLFYRLALFAYKILNNQMLPAIKQDLIVIEDGRLRVASRNIFYEPFCKYKKHDKRISFFLPKFCNKILRHSYTKTITEFKSFLLDNLNSNLQKFEKFFL